MLPSTGLFREFQCPYFDGNENDTKMCIRPFCHFKHAKKDSEPPGPKEEKPKYNATPLNAAEQEVAPEKEPTKKKPKLEYIPLPAFKSRIDYNNPGGQMPPPDEPVPVVEESEPPKEEEAVKEEVIPAEVTEEKVETPTEDKENIENKDQENISTGEKKPDEPVESKPDVEILKGKDEKPKKDKEESRTSRSSSHSSSSSSRHKHKSSSHKSSHHKSSKSSSRDRDRHRSSSSSHKSSSKKSSSSSSHKSSHHKSSSSSSARKEESRRSHSSSKSKDKDKERRKSREKEKPKEKTATKTEEKARPDVDSPSPVMDISDLESDEDDVMEQCKAIFEEYTQKPAVSAATTTPTAATNGKSEKHKFLADFESDEEPSDVSRKRVARDGAVKPLLKAPQKNLKLNPMQQIYKRQESMRQMVEAKMAAKQSSSVATVTVPTSPVNLPPTKGRPSIAPVSNMLAMKYAKAKIEALKTAQKTRIHPAQPGPSTSKTSIQTASKFYGRTAHVSHAPEPEARPAPPVLEPASTKISYNIRMQYYNMMVKHCLVIYPNCEDAWNRAQVEELAAQKKCNTANIYKSSALLTVNKLRKEALDSGNSTDDKKVISHDLILAGKGSTSWSVNKKLKTEKSQNIGNFDIMPGEKAYKLVLDCVATEDQLQQYGYPRGTPASVKIHSHKRPLPPNKEERYCSRCAKVFSLEMYDEIHIDECNFHPKSAGFRRGSADNFHYCCQLPAGTPGCQFSNYHVSDYLDYENLKGFVRTLDKDDDEFTPTKRDIFAFDCEMCYTRGGFELTRITVVGFDEKVVYDTLVKPDNEVVDYNTTYSGITEEQLSAVKTTIRDVQAVLLSMFHADTILIGHSLDSDMKAVKLIHDKVVDTAILYPHKMGLPKKRALKTLCIENLKRIIQENDGGHDSAEDAIACIQLVKHYLRNKII